MDDVAAEEGGRRCGAVSADGRGQGAIEEWVRGGELTRIGSRADRWLQTRREPEEVGEGGVGGLPRMERWMPVRR
ncbi:hypothetical protein HPP92_020351 [Vanilla planifolia]|uniref:Uncharacterized protein n=1 Tax=Vanilla planifolia TaxID=51239 RepID=A0A835UIC9_VANPL|nr:hypothetical protein HPP92_020351 [Vanilla planifolia]